MLAEFLGRYISVQQCDGAVKRSSTGLDQAARKIDVLTRITARDLRV